MPAPARPVLRRRGGGHRAQGFAVVAIVAALALTVTACGGKKDATLPGATPVTVTLTDGACTPNPTSVPSGPVTFTVKNNGSAAVTEAELKQKGVIIGEKENVTPGLSGTFSLRLAPGAYTVVCPDAKTSSSSFTVTGSATTPDAAANAAALKVATDSYRTYVVDEVNKLTTATTAFTDAVRAGDIPKAKELYAPAREHYESIEPVAESFGSLDPLIDARIDEVANTKTWSGFHRIERALWQDDSLAGTTQYANQLDRDVAKLKSLVATETYQPAQLANGATELLNEVGASKITGEEDRYSHTDLWDIKANVDGAQQAFELLKPALTKTDPALASTVAARFADVQSALQPYRTADGWVDYQTVTAAQRRALSQKVDALAEPLSTVAAQVA